MTKEQTTQQNPKAIIRPSNVGPGTVNPGTAKPGTMARKRHITPETVMMLAQQALLGNPEVSKAAGSDLKQLSVPTNAAVLLRGLGMLGCGVIDILAQRHGGVSLHPAIAVLSCPPAELLRANVTWHEENWQVACAQTSKGMWLGTPTRMLVLGKHPGMVIAGEKAARLYNLLEDVSSGKGSSEAFEAEAGKLQLMAARLICSGPHR